MSKAICCNKCGRCFDPLIGMHTSDIIIRFSNPVIRNLQDYVDGTISKYLFEELDDFDMIDLCPECSEKFIDFMLPDSGIEIEKRPSRRK